MQEETETDIDLIPVEERCRVLSGLLTETLKTGAKIWEELEIPVNDRQAKSDQFQTTIERICNDFLASEQALYQQIEDWVQTLRSEIHSLCYALEIDADQKLANLPKTLVSQHKELKAILAALQKQKDEMASTLQALHERLHTLWSELEDPVDPRFACVGDKYTSERIEEYKRAIAAAEEEKASRQGEIADLGVRIAQHWRRLGGKHRRHVVPTALQSDAPDKAASPPRAPMGPEGAAEDRKATSLVVSVLADRGSGLTTEEDRVLSVLLERRTEELGLGRPLITTLHSIDRNLAEEVETLAKSLEAIKVTVHSLWDELEISAEERERFEHALQTLHEANQLGASGLESDDAEVEWTCRVLEMYEEELRRLKALAADRLRQLIARAVKKLESLWDEIAHPPELRALFFEPFDGGNAGTIEFLTALNEEIAHWEGLLPSMRDTLKKIQHRELIKVQMKEFEMTGSDSTRLLAGGRRDPGRLLREEKFRRMVSNKFPKLTTSVRRTVTEWEAEHKLKFLYAGRSYLDIMGEEDDDPEFELLHLKLPTRKATPHTPTAVPSSPLAAALSRAPTTPGANPLRASIAAIPMRSSHAHAHTHAHNTTSTPTHPQTHTTPETPTPAPTSTSTPTATPTPTSTPTATPTAALRRPSTVIPGRRPQTAQRSAVSTPAGGSLRRPLPGQRTPGAATPGAATAIAGTPGSLRRPQTAHPGRRTTLVRPSASPARPAAQVPGPASARSLVRPSSAHPGGCTGHARSGPVLPRTRRPTPQPISPHTAEQQRVMQKLEDGLNL